MPDYRDVQRQSCDYLILSARLKTESDKGRTGRIPSVMKIRRNTYVGNIVKTYNRKENDGSRRENRREPKSVVDKFAQEGLLFK